MTRAPKSPPAKTPPAKNGRSIVDLPDREIGLLDAMTQLEQKLHDADAPNCGWVVHVARTFITHNEAEVNFPRTPSPRREKTPVFVIQKVKSVSVADLLFDDQKCLGIISSDLVELGDYLKRQVEQPTGFALHIYDPDRERVIVVEIDDCSWTYAHGAIDLTAAAQDFRMEIRHF